MIKQGKNGSLTLFFKDVLIGSYPLSKKKTYERYKYQGDDLILQTMRENKRTITEQISCYLLLCNGFLRKKKQGLNIWRSDYEIFLACIFALIKLRIIDEEDCVFIMPKKRISRHQKT